MHFYCFSFAITKNKSFYFYHSSPTRICSFRTAYDLHFTEKFLFCSVSHVVQLLMALCQIRTGVFFFLFFCSISVLCRIWILKERTASQDVKLYKYCWLTEVYPLHICACAVLGRIAKWCQFFLQSCLLQLISQSCNKVYLSIYVQIDSLLDWPSLRNLTYISKSL